MNFKTIRSAISRNLLNIPGWHTSNKIVVIESDDWGGIRMPSKKVYDALIQKCIRVDKLSFNRYDSLASEEDLSALFEVLIKFKDKNGNNPIITANCILTNPNFEEIRKSHFKEYHYELFTETLKRYPCHSGSFKLWKDGIDSNLFHPQFHGREHLNVLRWMDALRNDVGNIRIAFDFGMFDLSSSDRIISDSSFMDSLSFNDDNGYEYIKKSIIEGTKIFENIFGYRSSSFIAPCYIWDSKLEPTLAECGIKYIQGGYFQKSPIQTTRNNFRRKFHFTGEKNKFNQYFLVRNCSFEPSENRTLDHIEDCMLRINTAFRLHKPVIISTHRLNFIGYIDPKNRDENLMLFSKLLSRILKEHPNVEFKSTDQLGDLIANRKN